MVDIVKQGKALYLGISRWPLEALKFADQYLKERDCPLLIFQDRLNMLDHAPQENGTLDYCAETASVSSRSHLWHRDFSPTDISTEYRQTAVWQKSIF